MGSFHDFLVELHSEFGPVASFYYGQKYCVSLGSAETLRQVENCFDRPLFMYEFVKPLIGPKSVQYANGASGREVHRTMAAAFSHQACADALPKEASIDDVQSSSSNGCPHTANQHNSLKPFCPTLS